MICAITWAVQRPACAPFVYWICLSFVYQGPGLARTSACRQCAAWGSTACGVHMLWCCLASSQACKELRTEALHALLVCILASDSPKVEFNPMHAFHNIKHIPSEVCASKRAAAGSHKFWRPPHLSNLLIRSIRNEGQSGCAASQARALQTAHNIIRGECWVSR